MPEEKTAKFNSRKKIFAREKKNNIFPVKIQKVNWNILKFLPEKKIINPKKNLKICLTKLKNAPQNLGKSGREKYFPSEKKTEKIFHSRKKQKKVSNWGRKKKTLSSYRYGLNFGMFGKNYASLSLTVGQKHVNLYFFLRYNSTLNTAVFRSWPWELELLEFRGVDNCISEWYG